MRQPRLSCRAFSIRPPLPVIPHARNPMLEAFGQSPIFWLVSFLPIFREIFIIRV